ncbi:hypothetical protein [uncultured Sneathiella sp.]|jgi:hypothetical protein|uniref:hypothetical protein n=1 Tax=uncultured Sneathiella sp. TaxID=879315 RepID=UPI0030DD667C|tara:strand:+ start:2566 stop:3375 length:810 start_codon:yes stop_codon:yes gene_type:complete
MRETVEENNEMESGLDAASLSRIKVRRSKDSNSPRKVKSGDITDRLQALSDELEASKPAPTIAEPDFKKESGEPVPVAAKGKPKPAARPVKKPLRAKKAIDPETQTVSAVPPRRSNWARPAAKPGWQKKTVAPDILSYWLEIRGGKRYPTWQDLDTAKIGKFWPNCTLVHCDRAAGRLQLENGFASELRQVTRDESHQPVTSPGIDFSPMVVDWVLSLARDVANSGKPTHGTEYFPSTFDEIPLRVIALPLSENQIDIDHVLCYVQKLD